MTLCVWFPRSNDLVHDPGYFVYWFTFFLAGYIVACDERTDTIYSQRIRFLSEDIYQELLRWEEANIKIQKIKMDSIEYYDEFTLLAISNKKDESGEYIFDGDALELELIGFNENDGKIEIMIFYKFFYDRKTKKATTEEVMTKYNL